MAHSLLQARDSLSLSYTKFKVRRIRTALTLISTAVLALILVVASSSMTGFIKAASDTPQAQLTDLHLAQVYNSSSDSDGSPPPDIAKVITDKRNQIPSRFAPRDMYVQVGNDSSAATTFDLIPFDPKAMSASSAQDNWTGIPGFGTSVVGRSTELLQPFLDPSQNLNWKEGQPLPLFIPTSVLVEAHGAELDKIKDVEKRVNTRKSYEKALIGKTGKLSIANVDKTAPITFGEDGIPDAPAFKPSDTPPTVIDVRVVGFLPSTTSLTGSDGVTDFAVPYQLAGRVTALNKFLDGVDFTYPSFSKTSDRNAYVKSTEATIYADPLEENKQYFDGAKHVFNIAVLVMLALLAIPMAATVSKLLSDSQRETGVFRAIGARNHHILGIYGWYVVQMCVGSFAIALVIGELICGWLTLRYAPSVELAAADFADTPLHVSFVQFNVTQLGIILLGMLAGGFVGSAIPLWRAMRRDPIKALRDE